MDLLTDNPWRIAVLAPLEIDVEIDEEPSWMELDGEMIKLGSLSHESLNIPQIQQKALTLLSTKSKDVRIMAHLLKTLQHSGKTTELLLGLALLSDYVEVYWEAAPPKQNIKKVRLGQQILKRFDNMAVKFNQTASRLEKDEAKFQLERLKQYWSEQKLLDDVDALLVRYSFVEPTNSESIENKPIENVPASINQTPQNSVVSQSIVIEPLEVDQSNEKAWRNTLLKVADYLIDRDASEVVGYQLRRYAIWNNITSVPLSENNKTQLAAISADRVAEYKSALENADIALWKEVEYSLILAPFWFEGHYLSSEIAQRLGYFKVASTIKESLNSFLEKLPELKELTFSDNTPFLPQNCRQWLSKGSNGGESSNSVKNLEHNIDDYYDTEGLEKTLALINEQTYVDMRDKVYAQLQSIKLLERVGLHSLARQHYVTLKSALEQVSLKEWEPSLFTLLMKE